MKILIAGSGDTALHLAKMLSRENQDVVVMGKDRDVLSELDSGYNVITTLGKADSVHDQRNAGAAGCDLFIAVTPSGNLNIVAAEIADLLGAGTTLARIDNAELLADDMRESLRHLGIDTVVFPEYLAAGQIADSLKHGWVDSFYQLSNGALDLCSVKLREGAPLVGMTLREFANQAKNFHVTLIKRGDESIIPNGTTQFEKNDEIYLTTLPEKGKEIAHLCGKTDAKIKNVIMAGACKISSMLAFILAGSYNVKVIEPDKEKCREFALAHGNVTVINGDYRDNSLLREEGIRDNCAFVALTDTSETNIVMATVAKHIGAVKTMAQIEDIQYFEEARSLDIDTVINKKLITSSRIYQILLDNYLDSPRCLAFEDSEVIEIVIPADSSIAGRKVKDLKLPHDMTIAGIIRDGKGMLVTGDTSILAGDHVLVFCMNGSLRKVRNEFK